MRCAVSANQRRAGLQLCAELTGRRRNLSVLNTLAKLLNNSPLLTLLALLVEIGIHIEKTQGISSFDQILLGLPQ